MRFWMAKYKRSLAVALVLLAVLATALWYLKRISGPDLQEVERRLASGQAPTVVIELKGFLQQHPEHAQARYVLGKALLLDAQPEAADAEFTRATQHGMPVQAVASQQAAALLALGKSQELIARFETMSPPTPGQLADLKTHLAKAYELTGSGDKSTAALAAALAAVPDHAPATLLKASQLSRADNPQAAHALVDGVLAKTPGDVNAWALKGDLLGARPDTTAAALDAYRKALTIQPRHLGLHMATLSLMLRSGNPAGARTHWGEMSKAFPGHAMTLYFDAVLALGTGDVRHTREVSQALINAGFEFAPLYVVAGLAEARLGAMAMAEVDFSKAMLLAPSAAEPRRQLATMLLLRGEGRSAIDVLRPLVGANSQDAVALTLMARSLLAVGDYAGADQAFKRAARQAPTDMLLRTTRAQAMLGMGQVEAAFGELQTLADHDTGATADLALISARLSRNETDQAIRALDNLARKQPNSAFVDELRGRIAAQRGDRASARRAFEAALRKDPAHTAATLRLAALDMDENQPEAAKKRFEALFASNPQNVEALSVLADMARRGDARTKGLSDLLERAAQKNTGNATGRLIQVDLLARAGKSEAALNAAKAGAAALPNDPNLLERLVTLQLAAGEQNQAVVNLQRLTTLLPQSARPRLLLADLLRAQGSITEADDLVRQAIKLEPESTPVQMAAIVMAMREKQQGKALEIAMAIQNRLPDEATGFSLAGDVESSRGHWEEALAAYGQALKRRNPGNAAAGYHATLLKAGREREAATFEQSRLKSVPQDVSYMLFLSELAMRTSNFAQAESHLRKVIEVTPSHPVALNNLANVLLRQRKPGAKEVAERAVAVAPEMASVHDTLASVLADANQFAQAIETQRAAVKLAPNSGPMRLTLAKLYLRVGDKAKAREELGRANILKGNFAGQTEVAALLRELGPGSQTTTGMDTPDEPVMRAPVAQPAGSSGDPLQIVNIAVASVAVGLIVVLLVAAAQPATFRLVNSATIPAPREEVFEFLQDFRRWETWSGLLPFEQTLKRHYSGAPVGLHHRCLWSKPGEPMQGWVEIMQVAAPEKIVIEWSEDRPVEVRHLHEMVLASPDAATTSIQWAVIGPAPFGERVTSLLSGRSWRLKRKLAAALAGLKVAIASPSMPPPA